MLTNNTQTINLQKSWIKFGFAWLRWNLIRLNYFKCFCGPVHIVQIFLYLRYNYLHNTIFFIFLPACSVWTEQDFVWPHPLVCGRPPLCGEFRQHPLLPKINLQPLAYLIWSRWPRTRTRTRTGRNIIEPSLPRLMHAESPRRKSRYGWVWYVVVFHSKCADDAFYRKNNK